VYGSRERVSDVCVCERERETDRQTDRETERDRETEQQRVRESEREKESERARELTRTAPILRFYPDQFTAEANAAIHERTTGPEILEALAERKLDHIFMAYGTGQRL